jgi:hypothetical protein
MHPTSPEARLCDLMRQGFMKPRKPKRTPVERPIVACDDCLNWHRKGKHTSDKATRAARKAERAANAK